MARSSHPQQAGNDAPDLLRPVLDNPQDQPDWPTENAKERAENMAKATGNKVALARAMRFRDVFMGVLRLN
jgi:hypothetical protein